MITLTDYAIIGMAMASFSAFLLILAAKWKVIEKMQVHGNDFFAKMANCDFCLSWWVNVIMAVSVTVASGETSFLLMPFVTTIVTRKLI